MTFTLRNRTLYLRKRVPARFRQVEDRDYVWLSLRTDSETIAKAKAPGIWAEMIEAWEAKLAGANAEGEGRMQAARELAAKRGYRFMAAAQVAKLPLPELLERVESVVTPKGKIDRVERRPFWAARRHQSSPFRARSRPIGPSPRPRPWAKARTRSGAGRTRA